MKIALDIGGVISKYPDEFKRLAESFLFSQNEVFVITDMHDKAEVRQTLDMNGFGCIPDDHVYCADYTTHGELCKAVLLKELRIDILIDDFPGYVQWDSSLGPAPIRLFVAPDPFRPYWHPEWKTVVHSDFGRRVYKHPPAATSVQCGNCGVGHYVKGTCNVCGDAGPLIQGA